MEKSTRPVVVNIVNFVRAFEPRDNNIDLMQTMINQAEAMRELDLPGSFLLQHDALVCGDFVEYIKTNLAGDKFEIGGWWEIPQSLVEKAGMQWRGRYSWDWHCNVGFSIGYTPAEREKLVDAYMADYKNIFGRYPASVGSWFIDSHTLNYMADEYGVIASCNCRDQWGTDGYTLWGGYWNQAYYPSRLNSFMPAQSADKQLKVPIFRMLGSDPIYQYEAAIGNNGQAVITLEPAYPEGGGDPKWVRWFFRQMLKNPSLSFAYAQVGQENSFGWELIKDGYLDQLKYLGDNREKFRIETLETTGCWFRENFETTPPAATIALEDWQNCGRTSVWYNCKNYRANLFTEGNVWRLRDIQLFDEKYVERYIKQTTDSNTGTYDTLPVMDGFRWTDDENDRAGIYLADDTGNNIPINGEPRVEQLDENTLQVTATLENGGEFITEFSENAIFFEMIGNPVNWQLVFNCSAMKTDFSVCDNKISYVYEGFKYSISLKYCMTCQVDRKLIAKPVDSRMVFSVKND